MNDALHTPLPSSTPRPRTALKLAVGVVALVVLVAAVVALIWRPWEERFFAADEVPSACADLAVFKDAELPGSAPGEEELIDEPGAFRDPAAEGPGSTFMCGWTDGSELVLRLYVEYWADGVDAAAASFARSYSHGTSLDVGDEALAVQQVPTGIIGQARIGNVIVHVIALTTPPNELTDEDMTRFLRGLLATVDA